MGQYAISCNSTSNAYLMSELCLDEPDSTSIECVSTSLEVSIVRYIEGTWLLIVAIIGAFGNFVTFLSIVYAARKRVHGLDHKFREITIFILHLCFVDFCWCIFCALPSSCELLIMKWPFGKQACALKVMADQIILLTESLSVASISVSRSFDLKNANLWRKCTHNNILLLVMLLLPLFTSLPALTPYFVTSMGIAIGWNCMTGKCDVIEACNVSECDGVIPAGGEFIGWYDISFVSVSLSVIIISYVLLRKEVISSANYLKKEGHVTIELHRRELKMTRTILFLISAHGLCNIPMLINQALNFYEVKINFYLWHLLMIIYVTQPALNFFIYAGSNEQYQLAYIDFWRYITFQARK